MAQQELPVLESRPAHTLSIRPAARAQPPRPAGVDPVRRVQRGAGNQAMQHLAEPPAPARAAPPGEPERGGAAGNPGQSAGQRCACGAPAGLGGECAACRARRLRVQRAAVAPAAPDRVPDSVSAALRQSGGRPLEAGLRRSMEAALGGAGLHEVRLHTGLTSQQAARDIAADAFTYGQDIHFAADRFQPRTADGLKLLAHELAHTVQQQRAGGHNGTAISQPHEPQEQEADRAADAIAAGRAPGLGLAGPRASTPAIQRQRTLVAAGPTTRTLVAAGPTTGTPAPAADLGPIADTIAQAVRAGDVSASVVPLRPFRNRPLTDIASLRDMVHGRAGVFLEHWLVARMHAEHERNQAEERSLLTIAGGPELAMLLERRDAAGAAPAEEGLRILWRALPLIDRLEIYDEGYREIEQAQLDVIRASSAEERAAARKETERLDAIYENMSGKEEYEARSMIDPSAAGLYTATAHLLARAKPASGIFSAISITGTSEERDALYDAILALAPADRRRFFDEFVLELHDQLPNWQFLLVSTLAQGSEVQALIARLRLATEGRTDDQAAVQNVVDRAVALLRERRELRAAVESGGLSAAGRATAEARLQELGELDSLVQFQREPGGALRENTFMGLVASARGSSEAFAADASRLAEFAPPGAGRREYAKEVAKQRILLADGDVDTIRAAILSLHAPPVQASDLPPGRSVQIGQWEADIQFRQELLADPAVAGAIGSLTGFEQMRVANAIQGDDFDEVLQQANLAYHGGRYGEFFRLILRISRNEGWRGRFQRTSTDPFGLYANVSGDERTLMETILRTQHMPFADLLAYTGDVDLLKEALGDIPEEDRARLRLGWTLLRDRLIGPLTQDQEAALREYQDFEAQVRASQTSRLGTFDAAGFEAVLRATLGSEPTAEELATPEGRYHAAALMFERLEGQLRLERGLAASFTETDETMDAAGREFASLWIRVRDQHTLTMIDFSALSALYQRFQSRAEEFGEAENAIGELAGMIAATVAGVVVVVATGGTATPAVIALAAASGAGARVVTREMFGGDYYNALSDQGARDALLGAVDGALAVVSGSLAARGTELLGLGGHALTSNAARVAGEVAEQATQSLTRRVAASAVESGLDSAFSGAISQAFGTMLDARTWRRGILDGLARVGQAALLGGLAGLGGGVVMGAAMPIVGRGASLLWNAAVGRSIENTLARAGAAETLAAARRAALDGNVAEVNRLAAELETHLAPQETAALRDQLYADLRQTLGHPPGTAAARDEVQGRLLAESGAVEDGAALSPEQLDAEKNIVSRSEPQPSREPGYVDEVDLGNGHSWRRREDGTWCRFTKVALCGSDIPNPHPLPAVDPIRARIAASEGRLKEALETIAAEREVQRRYNQAVDAIVARVRRGERFSFAALSDAEKEAIEHVFTRKTDPALENLTLRDLQAVRNPTRRSIGRRVEEQPSRLEAEMSALYDLEEAALRDLRESSIPLYDKLRAASPTERLRDRVLRRRPGLDEVSRRPPLSGALDVDHTVPLREIMDMEGFGDLSFEDQLAVVNYEPNLQAVDRSANRSRGARSWANTDWSARGGYSPDALQRVIAEEARMRQEIQNDIRRRLGRPAVP